MNLRKFRIPWLALLGFSMLVLSGGCEMECSTNESVIEDVSEDVADSIEDVGDKVEDVIDDVNDG